MFADVNRAAMQVCKVAHQTKRQHLAALIYTYVPVTNEREFEMLRAQVRVLRTLLKLKPTHSVKLVDAVNALIREVTVVGDSLRTV